MAFEYREGQGTVFRNEEKAAENHADYQGKARINGEMYYLNMRVKQAKSGKKYFSVSIKPIQKKPSQQEKVQQQFGGDYEDDIPF